jgi:hypothetical protein
MSALVKFAPVPTQIGRTGYAAIEGQEFALQQLTWGDKPNVYVIDRFHVYAYTAEVALAIYDHHNNLERGN